MLAFMLKMNQDPGIMSPVILRFHRALAACAINTHAALGIDPELSPAIFPIVKSAFEGAFVLGYLVAESEKAKTSPSEPPKEVPASE